MPLSRSQVYARRRASLEGCVVAISGAARGIGLATAHAVRQAGGVVAIGDLDGELAASAAEQLGGGCFGMPLDVTSRDSFDTFLNETESRLGPLDTLINNAGVMPIGRFVDEDESTARLTIDVDLHGVINGSNLALQRMLPRQSGHIVNVASMAGRFGTANISTYCAAKHGVIGLTESLRAEYRHEGIAFSYVMPSAVATDLGSGLGKIRGLPQQRPEAVAEATVAAMKSRRVQVWVPRQGRGLFATGVISPRPVVDLLTRYLSPSGGLEIVDPSARAAHDARLHREDSAPRK